MSKFKLSEEVFGELVEEVLARLARDESAAHLWHWRGRPGCEDEPAGLSRRRHLRTLLGLVGLAATPLVAGACKKTTTGIGTQNDAAVTWDAGSDAGPDAGPDASCADDPCAADAGPDASCSDDPCGCADDPCCSDDPCGCADDPCSCGDDPCCADDPCGCADDPCSCGDDPCGCADDPCGCSDDPCGCADDPCSCGDDPCA